MLLVERVLEKNSPAGLASKEKGVIIHELLLLLVIPVKQEVQYLHELKK
jgi:hypothetical protein